MDELGSESHVEGVGRRERRKSGYYEVTQIQGNPSDVPWSRNGSNVLGIHVMVLPLMPWLPYAYRCDVLSPSHQSSSGSEKPLGPFFRPTYNLKLKPAVEPHRKTADVISSSMAHPFLHYIYTQVYNHDTITASC